MNLTRRDIIGLSGLDEDEVAAIAEHEHVPEVIAAALANYLLHMDKGAAIIRGMMKDDIRAALDHGDIRHASLLFQAMHKFAAEYPPH